MKDDLDRTCKKKSKMAKNFMHWNKPLDAPAAFITNGLLPYINGWYM